MGLYLDFLYFLRDFIKENLKIYTQNGFVVENFKQKKLDSDFSKLANNIIKTINGKVNKSYANTLAKCNPIHPLVTLLLNPISRQRFGQNERSIFSFLNSGEPNGFLYFLQNQ